MDRSHMITQICESFLRGFEKGYQHIMSENPYEKDSDDWIAWDFGYKRGFGVDVHSNDINCIPSHRN